MAASAIARLIAVKNNKALVWRIMYLQAKASARAIMWRIGE
jgi:hypothetical protein